MYREIVEMSARLNSNCETFNQHLYDNVVLLIREYSPECVILPESRLYHDLGIDGEDAEQLFHKLSKEFGVDLTNLSLLQYFEAESPFSFFLAVFKFLSQILTKRPSDPKKIPVTVFDVYRAAEAGQFVNLPSITSEIGQRLGLLFE